MNAPDRHEAIYLDEGEKKVVHKPDTRLPHHTIFTFNKEDHTLGNLLTERLNSMPHVIFAAYRVPHPLFPNFELRVGTDGEITPKDALMEACRGTVQDLQTLSNEFVKEWALSEARRTAEGNDNMASY